MNDEQPDQPQPDAERTLLAPGNDAKTTILPPPGRQDSGNALPIGMYLDEFELRSVAGEGGFSIVYRAWDHSLNRQVALKEYFPSGMVGRSGGTQVVVRSERHAEAFEAGLKAFVKEAQLLAQFDHPALIKVYRFWRANGSAYMVMPFCEGITLRDQWRAMAESPDEQAFLTLLNPLTEALAVLHAEHWYHRDIAPDNVMLLSPNQRPLLLDFGAARQVIGDMTRALTVILKPGYAPIEQWGEVPGMKQGPWTDVYALGAMIHFGITRHTPPPSVGRLINDNYEPLVQVAAGRYSERFLAAVDHALAVRPEQRTQSIDQFRDEIGLNEFAPQTMAWPSTGVYASASPASLPPAPAPDLALPAAAPSGVEFTQRLGAPALETTVMQPASPPAGGRSPATLFGIGLVVTAVLGGGAYLAFKPAPAPAPAPHQARQLPTPPTPASPAGTQASTPAAPTAAAEGPAADFARIVAARTAGLEVDVNLVRTTVRSEKDAIEFTVRSNQDGYVYVLNHGSDGSLLQIYPNRKSGLLRIRKDAPLDLPRKVDDELRIAGPSGSNQLLVIVSRQPRDMAAPMRVDGGYAYFHTGPAATAIAAKHTGPLPWIAGKAKCPTSAACADEFGAAVAVYSIVQ